MQCDGSPAQGDRTKSFHLDGIRDTFGAGDCVRSGNKDVGGEITEIWRLQKNREIARNGLGGDLF